MEVKHGLQSAVYDLGCGEEAASTIERTLAATDGVVNVHMNPATETDTPALARVIEQVGYRAGRPIEA